MTGYGRGHSSINGTKFSVELNSVNRKQSDLTVNLPRELAELEPRIRDVINSQITRGRLNVVVAYHTTSRESARLALDSALARDYYKAMLDLQRELGASGDISIETVLRAPGVVRLPDEHIGADIAWPSVHSALLEALSDLIKMREKEGKYIVKDLVTRMKLVRQLITKIRELHPNVIRKHRKSLQKRIQRAGINLPIEDDRLVKEVIFFADKSDISEELVRLESHLRQFTHQLRQKDAVGRTLDFITQEIYRELNTLGAKANDADISQLVVTCKAEMEKVREQIQNIE
jgi:uncharacterized protein (TIGR00255 family)